MLVKYYKNELLACDDISTLAECFKTIIHRPFPLNCHIFIDVCILLIIVFKINVIIYFLFIYF